MKVKYCPIFPHSQNAIAGMCGSRGGGGAGGPDPPWKITKLQSQHSMLGHHRPAGETPFNGVLLAGQWWPFYRIIWILCKKTKNKKRCQSWTPSEKNFLIRAWLVYSILWWKRRQFPNGPFRLTPLVFLAYLSHWLMVSYCDNWTSVVRRVSSVVNNCFKGHHLLNYWMDLNQTWQEWSLYCPLQ